MYFGILYFSISVFCTFLFLQIRRGFLLESGLARGEPCDSLPSFPWTKASRTLYSILLSTFFSLNQGLKDFLVHLALYLLFTEPRFQGLRTDQQIWPGLGRHNWTSMLGQDCRSVLHVTDWVLFSCTFLYSPEICESCSYPLCSMNTNVLGVISLTEANKCVEIYRAVSSALLVLNWMSLYARILSVLQILQHRKYVWLAVWPKRHTASQACLACSVSFGPAVNLT